MARALSQIVTVIRGSVGGITWTANQWHQILLRARTAPVQPQTVAQNWIKTAFASASESWKAMSSANQELWRQYGQTVVYTGPMGEYTLPGRQIFIANLTLVNYLNESGADTITPILDPPEINGRYAFDSITAVDLSAPGTGFGISVANPAGEAAAAVMEISRAFGASRLRYKGPFLSGSLVSLTLAADTSTFQDFSGLVENSVYFVRIRGLSTESPHRLTKETILRVTATVVAV